MYSEQKAFFFFFFLCPGHLGVQQQKELGQLLKRRLDVIKS